MGYIIILLILICGYNIIKNTGQKRLNWFICSIMLFSSSIIIWNKPQIPCHRFFIICFWLSVLRQKEYRLKSFPLKIPLIIYVIGFLIIGFNSPYLNIFYKIYKPLALLLDTYLILLLTCYGIKNESFYSKAIVNTLFFVTIYGVITFIIRSNPIQEFISSTFGNSLLSDYYWGERIRICSTWSHPISYGFICSTLFYELLPFIRKRKVKILLLLLFINVLICGSRTSLAAFLLMGGIYIMFRYNISKSIIMALIIITLAIPVYLFVPIVQEKVDSIILTAKGEDNVQGSSLEMRDAQTEAALLITSEYPIFGHGYDYIQEGLGYGTDNFKGDWRLLGFESYIYVILIERGFFGLVIEIIILLSILTYAYRKRKINRKDCSFIIACCIGYIFFSVSTGTLDTKIITLFMIGFSICKIQYQSIHKNEKEISNSNSCV